jgi:ABC-type branched-subunit amino acid transport system ATPase component
MSSRAYVLNRCVITFDGTSEELRDEDVFERYLGESVAEPADQ